jgi:hypothetical protein
MAIALADRVALFCGSLIARELLSRQRATAWRTHQ